MAIQKGGKFYDSTSGDVLVGNLSGGIDFTWTANTEETAVPSDTADKPEVTAFTGRFTLTGQWNPADTGMAGLVTKLMAGTRITTAKLVLSGTVGGSGVGYSGAAVPTNFRLGAKFKAYQSFSCDILTYDVWTASAAL